MKEFDYSVYLVTGRDLLPPGKSYLECIEQALQGGVTVVQVREKTADTGEFIRIAQETKDLCDKYDVPVIINDRVDVALAIGAPGVHLGQDDMHISRARELLPPGTIIGISCNTVDEVKQAVEDGADYVGVGAVWGTKTKNLTSPIIGVRGVGKMLEVLDGTGVKAVAIGGIKEDNMWRTLHGCVSTTDHRLDGVAVVSEIMAAENPHIVAGTLSLIHQAFVGYHARSPPSLTSAEITADILDLLNKIRGINLLVHQITNNVVATQSANVTLAVGASPIMATEPAEMEDLAKVCGALLVNIGTMTAAGVDGARLAGFHANKNRKPVVFDPVGVGATAFRKESVAELLDQWQASVIKGNAGELAALAGNTEVLSKGVDSVGSGFKDPVAFVKGLAKRERCVTVLTGAVDYISDGDNVVSLANGDPVLGRITGSGCMLGSIIAAFCAAALHEKFVNKVNVYGKIVHSECFVAAITGVLVLTIASEVAKENGAFSGPGSFLPALIDALWTLEPADVVRRARVTVH